MPLVPNGYQPKFKLVAPPPPPNAIAEIQIPGAEWVYLCAFGAGLYFQAQSENPNEMLFMPVRHLRNLDRIRVRQL